MAAINRFMAPRNKDYSWANPKIDVWEPNYDAWLTTLDNQQKTFDVAKGIATTIPEYAKFDEAALQDYIKTRQSKIDAVTDLYTKNDIVGGNQAMRQLMAEHQKDWSPGGTASQFKKRSDAYKAIQENIAKTYEKSP